jgi:hypothetical protein
MIRRALILAAFMLIAAMSTHLYSDTRYLLRAHASVPALLGVEDRAPATGVMIVMQPEDCLKSGEMVERWNTLHRTGRVAITALVVGSGRLSPAQRDVFEEHAVELPLRPIRLVDAQILAEKLGYVSTPFAVVLDKNGRVAGSFPASQNVPIEVLEALVAGRA